MPRLFAGAFCCFYKGFWLLNFLLQPIKFRRRKNFADGNSKPVTYHFDCQHFGVLAFPI